MISRILPFLFLLALTLHAEPFVSTGGFSVDPPPGYQVQRSTAAGQLSFVHRAGASFELDLRGSGEDPAEHLQTVLSRLGSRSGEGEIEAFDYHGRRAAIVRLNFSLDNAGRPARSPAGARTYEGWALCLDRGEDLLLALAYGPGGNPDLELLGLSCLDSIAPGPAEQHYWGPITEFAWPRGEPRETPLFNSGVSAQIAAGDAEAAQGLVDREFQVLRQFEQGPQWQEAWRRFYRMIRRDSWERLADALFQLERSWNVEALQSRAVLHGRAAPQRAGPEDPGAAGLDGYALAARALSYVQGFRYERDLMGSDFVNLVSAVTEGRGDCDSRALLWALFLAQANIPAGIMVSRDYGHAMGIADIEGPGARFPLTGRQYLVAETSAPVDLGLISQNQSEIAKWLGVMFE
ncbi:MAG: hypothetical protein LBI94_06930 [Treponema sp.]|jgi:hypothetical protein|nr:hypothetical protein [Treponema sp.]